MLIRPDARVSWAGVENSKPVWRKHSVNGSFLHWMTGIWCDPNSDHFCYSLRLESGKLPTAP
jgi:hypothetical protein